MLLLSCALAILLVVVIAVASDLAIENGHNPF